MISRRGFLKGLAAAAVVVQTGLYAIADKISPPPYAIPVFIADGAVAKGVDSFGDGWYKCWATWSNNVTHSVYVRSILQRETNTMSVPYVVFKEPPIKEYYESMEEAGVNIGAIVNSDAHLWGMQVERGAQQVNHYIGA